MRKGMKKSGKSTWEINGTKIRNKDAFAADRALP
jgi:hypothetical protein